MKYLRQASPMLQFVPHNLRQQPKKEKTCKKQ